MAEDITRIELEHPIPLVVKVISNGRISIPRDIRELLEVEEGDYLVLEIRGVVKTVNHDVKKIVADTAKS
ncbi:AbrB/MazE/SpoVT family DNA-binding domain-containing protein [Thermococcus sp.]|uniref:AbrB/MazE/SpoVT family DNA-binding domain-containing protein n=1 Tax=Thermococcus sp. TaxID=35749 RepID=UPI002624D3D7|nr:AbrB/MazE/SpoVT family DNA-binding domain-containing protein [Thermococcus sp.]